MCKLSTDFVLQEIVEHCNIAVKPIFVSLRMYTFSYQVCISFNIILMSVSK